MTREMIAAKQRERAARRMERANNFAAVAERRNWVNTPVQHESRIRGVVIDSLRGKTGLSKMQIYTAVYTAFGLIEKGYRRRRFRESIEIVLRKLYLEGVIHLPQQNADASTDAGPRRVSMIYLLPTNDIPINRLAASVIGPVWGATQR